MTNTPHVSGDRTKAGRSRGTRRRASIAQQPKSATAKAAEVEKITTLEIASYEGGRKELSVVSRITMPMAIKILALVNQESKV
jgi:hypothetical protein